MSNTSAFLNALFGAYEDELFFDREGFVVSSNDPEWIIQNDGKLRVFPANAEQVFFLFAVQEESSADAYLDCRAKPSVAMHRDGMSLFCWAFESPVDLGDPKVTAVMEVFEMYTLEESIPLPGTDGWECVHADPETFYTPDSLARVYLEEMPEEAAPEPEGFPIYREHARMITPYNEEDYKGREITISLGGNQFSRDWKPQTIPLTGLIYKFAKHEIGKKDGLAVVFADMVPGQRVKKAIKSCSAIGLDIDTGTPSAVVDKAIQGLNCLAIRTTTHSHGSRSSEFPKDEILKLFPNTSEVTTEMVQEYLRTKKHWEEYIVETVAFIDEDHTAKGIVCRVSHIEMPKHRVIVPLIHPYMIAEEGRTQMEAIAKWAKVPAALAAKLGVPFDRSCTDPSRLFYLPRHDKNRPFEISLFGGAIYDLESLQLENEFDAVAAEFEKASKGQSKSVTPEGKALGKWWLKFAPGFQMMDVIDYCAPDKKRSKASNGYNIECPFDEDHSNAGDRSDQACFAVNAAEGANEFFGVFCQHSGCKDKTSLDMLGKMLKDEWFERSVIEDPNFNIAEIEEAPEAKAKAKTAEKEAKEEKAQSAWEIACDSLTTDSKAEDMVKVFKLLYEAKLTGIHISNACKRIAKKCNSTFTAVRTFYKEVEAQIKKDAADPDPQRDDQGRKIFRYEGGINFHAATSACMAEMQAENFRKSPVDGRTMFHPRWCHMEGTPVEIVQNPKTNHLEFKEYGEGGFWSELCERTVFVKKTETSDGTHDPVPRNTIADHAFHQVSKHLPVAPEIIYTPLFAADGTLISAPGYYGGVAYPDVNILLPDDALQIGDINAEPTLVDVETAVNWLRNELLGDFPFMDHDLEGNERREPSEANAFAMLLTPFMRRMISSCTPIFFISKPMAGTGGTLLGQLPMLLFDGMTSAPARYSNNDEEMNKSLVTEILSGRMCMFYDDVKEFNNREILRAVTSKQVGGRVLGGSRKIERDNNFLWIATGNNPVILNEMERRIVWIRLNAKKADIQNRTFRHDLYSFLLGETVPEIREGQRATAVRHLLTMIQFWISTGMEPFLERKRASFEDWSAKVGGVLMVCGIEGFLDNRKAEGQDIDEASIKTYMRFWLNKYGAEERVIPSLAFTEASTAMQDIIEGSNDDQKKHRFFRRLPTIEGRTFNIDGRDYMMCSGHDRDQNVAYYLLDITDPEATPMQQAAE